MTRGKHGTLGIDVGGSFTDFVLTDHGGDVVALHKHLTTYPDPTDGVIRGLTELLQKVGLTAGDLRRIIHSSTLVTNALLEGKGARTGLLTTSGFVHVLDLGREQRYDAYDLFLAFPDPLVPLERRRAIKERTLKTGEILRPVDLDEVRAAVEELVEQGVESIAIAFINAYVNPHNEEQAAEFIRKEFPGLHVSLSSKVSPVIGEWERTCTTAANALVQPIVEKYLQNMGQQLSALGFRGQWLVTLSAGGSVAPPVAAAYPIRMLESGPAAGVLAASGVGHWTGHGDLLAFDMGGTTAKLCLVADGRPQLTDTLEIARVHRFKRGSGLPIRVASIELIEIGAGGGSQAFIDDLGLLRVGPESSGSSPGPACYGLGGTVPTVTDANLLLGYYDTGRDFGGVLRLDEDAARRAVAGLADVLGLSVLETAWRIHQVVNENMARAARMHLIEQGRDPSRLPIVASGGAGPAHATAIARLLGAGLVIIPGAAGNFSAWGCVAAPVSFTASRTSLTPLRGARWESVNSLLTSLEQVCTEQLVQAGVSRQEARIRRWADCRLEGQIHTVRIVLPDGPLSLASMPALTEAFRTEYERLFARSHPVLPIEVVNWHVSAETDPGVIKPPRELADAAVTDRAAPVRCQQAYFPEAGGLLDTPVYYRPLLASGVTVNGPAVIAEDQATTVLRPGDRARVDEFGNLVVEVSIQ